MSNRRLEMYQYRQIILQMREGETDRAIARAGLVGRTKATQIRKLADEQGWLEADNELPEDAQLAEQLAKPTASNGQAQQSKITMYHEQITQWFEDGLQATTIHQALIRQFDYTGAYDSVQRFIKTLKGQSLTGVTVPLHFEPGEAAQVDFGQGPMLPAVNSDKPIKTWFFVMTLCWSRHQYSELVTNQSVETWLGCHRRAFEWFNGVPSKIIIDNPKCAIIKACIYEPQVQRSYHDCAEEFAFIISPCPPRDPQKKGRVEAGVKFVKRNFMPLRHFRDLTDANVQLKDWVMTTAGHRTHGSTFKQPLKQFSDLEQSSLKSLPAVIPELARWEKGKVYNHCHVRFEKNFYSAPYQYVGQIVWLKASETTVRIYVEHELIAIHVRSKELGKYVTIMEHLPPNAQYYFKNNPEWCREQAAHIGEFCLQVVAALLDDAILDYMRAVQALLRLVDTYGRTRLEKACHRALHFHAGNYKTIKAILENGLDHEVLQRDQDFEALAKVYQGDSKYLCPLSTHTH
jgi:transposase